MNQVQRTPTILRIGTYLAIGWSMQAAAMGTAGHATWIMLGCIGGAIAAPLLLGAGIARVVAWRTRDRSTPRAKLAVAPR
jgi:hypothetical protein